MSPESQPAARASKRPRRADAERNRAALLAAAERLFDERGTDVPLDEIAKAAEVANATLYRHFATRADLIAAVYAEEVRDLDRLSDRLLDRTDPDQALTEWLRAFMRHVATKRDLALAIPDEPDGERDGLFAGWHATMRAAAARLLARAQRDRAVPSELDAADLLVVVSGIALTGLPEDRLDRLLHLVRDGYRIRPAATE
ncbi:TetR/AcrR family transcriptional regulator [Nocardia wallacei]|uniref:TetR/AcrR family transcriptional regulator n=1 Tax=Nocardia wallacei TaxID=480035 RepID=UPI0024561A90|nr:TetR family transcriptional regulator [Nocardia wallacei]